LKLDSWGLQDRIKAGLPLASQQQNHFQAMQQHEADAANDGADGASNNPTNQSTRGGKPKKPKKRIKVTCTCVDSSLPPSEFNTSHMCVL
jgi:hypothetical protein